MIPDHNPQPALELPTEGLLLIDKPEGWTSHDVVGWVRRRTRVKRVGHAGTLDPLATGLLIVLVGREWTKKQQEFLKQDKKYEVTAQLGLTTDTYDSTGQVTNQADWEPVASISKTQLLAVTQALRGEQDQTVPAFSAVKRSGMKLYELARAQELDLNTLPKRTVHIHEFELLTDQIDEQAQQRLVSWRVKCSSGTYIRSLLHDLGQKLGVGATVTALRRTKIGELDIKQAISLPQRQSR